MDVPQIISSNALKISLGKALVLKARARATRDVRSPKPLQGSRGVWPQCDVPCLGSEKLECQGMRC